MFSPVNKIFLMSQRAAINNQGLLMDSYFWDSFQKYCKRQQGVRLNRGLNLLLSGDVYFHRGSLVMGGCHAGVQRENKDPNSAVMWEPG